jgi:autotransporter-associated beta strand protein
VGLNNLSTEVSGVIMDGGSAGGIGGTLVKQGTGTLTLSGVNTYTGGTTIEGGVISVASNDNLGATTGGLILQGSELLTTTSAFNTDRRVVLSGGGPNTLAAATGTTGTYTGVLSMVSGSLKSTNTCSSVRRLEFLTGASTGFPCSLRITPMRATSF